MNWVFCKVIEDKGQGDSYAVAAGNQTDGAWVWILRKSIPSSDYQSYSVAIEPISVFLKAVLFKRLFNEPR